MSDEDLSFIKRFVLASGSLKEVAAGYGISYPTVRLRLDRLIAKITVVENTDIRSEFERLLRVNTPRDGSMRTPSRHCWPRTARTSSARARLSDSFVCLAMVALFGPAGAGPRATIRWDELQREGRVPAGSVLPPSRVLVHQSENRRRQFHPARVTVPRSSAAIKGPRYVVSGQIRYEGVEGAGYLEMWSYFRRRPVLHTDAGRRGPDDEAAGHGGMACVHAALRRDGCATAPRVWS